LPIHLYQLFYLFPYVIHNFGFLKHLYDFLMLIILYLNLSVNFLIENVRIEIYQYLFLLNRFQIILNYKEIKDFFFIFLNLMILIIVLI